MENYIPKREKQESYIHRLKIKSGDGTCKFFLDDFEVKGVTGYELKGCDPTVSELTLKVSVSTTDSF